VPDNALWQPDAIPGTRDNLLAPQPTWADAATQTGNAAMDWIMGQRALPPQSASEIGGMYASSLLMGTISPATIAGRLAKYADKMGYSVAREGSALSGSQYLNLSHESLDGPLKVRISDHNLPPSYGVPGDIDVHAGTPREESVGWSDAVKHLADRIGVSPPSAGSLAADARAAKLGSFDGQVELLRKAFPGQPILRDPNAYASQYEAANPGKVAWTPHFNMDQPK